MERRLRLSPPKNPKKKFTELMGFFLVFLGFLESHVETTGIRVRQLTEPEFSVAPSAHELDVLDEATARYEQRVSHLVESKETLERRQAELIEFRHVLRETASFFNVFYP